MPRRATCFALTVMGALVAISPASASSAGHEGAKGHISIQQQTFAGTQFGTPTGNPTLVTTDPLEIPLTEGESFRTSTIRCDAGPAPYNDVGLALTPSFPGLPDPAPIRSFITGTVTEAMSGDRGTIRGTITSFVCEDGQATDQITESYRGHYEPSSETQLVLRGGPLTTTGGIALDGRFRIIDGTGRFADMKGGGSIWMQLTCLPSTLTRNGATSCADLGAYSEAIPLLEGRFKAPTIPAS
jgi:hypothetical protein